MTTSRDPTVDSPTVPSLEPTSSSSLEVYYRARLENIHRRLPELARELQRAGVARVLIQYDGCGDSGQIEGVELLDAAGNSCKAAGTLDANAETLRDLMYDLIESRHPGWENEEGGSGDLEWDLVTDHLRHTHNDRFTEYHTTEHEGL